MKKNKIRLIWGVVITWVSILIAIGLMQYREHIVSRMIYECEKDLFVALVMGTCLVSGIMLICMGIFMIYLMSMEKWA